MKLNELKSKLNKLTKEELGKDVILLTDYTSGPPEKIYVGKAKYNLYWDGADDPSMLYTKSQLKKDGYSDEDIQEEFDLEVKKGSFIIDCRTSI